MLSNVRWILAAAVIVVVGMAGCGGTTGPAEPGTDCDWVVGGGTSGADGLVTIDMGALGTFRAKVRDGLTSEPVAGAQYICVASACSDEVSCITTGGDGYQVGLYTYNRDDVITNQGTDTAGNQGVVVDRKTGTIWVAFTIKIGRAHV